jgi:cytochrome c553
MKRLAVTVVLAMGISFPILADAPPSGKSQPVHLLRLSDIMIATQLRHFKLWDAGRVKNWGLANYELALIRASLEYATRLDPNTPVANTTTTQPADEVGSAIDAKDSAKFAKAFDRLTSACNSCHEAAGFGFIAIRPPRLSPLQTSPFSNESFSPNPHYSAY